MTMTERNELRKLQDKVIKKLEKAAWKNEDRFSDLQRPDGYGLILKDLKQYLWPCYKQTFINFLNNVLEIW